MKNKTKKILGTLAVVASLISVGAFFRLDYFSVKAILIDVWGYIGSNLDAQINLILSIVNLALLVFVLLYKLRPRVRDKEVFLEKVRNSTCHIKKLYFHLGGIKSKYLKKVIGTKDAQALEMIKNRFDDQMLDIFCEASRHIADDVKLIGEKYGQETTSKDIIRVVIVLLNPKCEACGELIELDGESLLMTEVVNAFFDNNTWIKKIKPYLGVDDNELENYKIMQSTALREIANGNDFYICNDINNTDNTYNPPPDVYEKYLEVNAKIVIPIQHKNMTKRNCFGFIAVMSSNKHCKKIFNTNSDSELYAYMKHSASLLAMIYYGIAKAQNSFQRVMIDQSGFILSERATSNERRHFDIELSGESVND